MVAPGRVQLEQLAETRVVEGVAARRATHLAVANRIAQTQNNERAGSRSVAGGSVWVAGRIAEGRRLDHTE